MYLYSINHPFDELQKTVYAVHFVHTVHVTSNHVRGLVCTYTLRGGYSEYRC